MNAQCERYAREMHIRKMNDKIQLERHWKMQHRAKATTNPEFDLNDPLSLKKDKPARIGDNDQRCGVSSLQMFEGEDLGMAQRVKDQEAALRVSRLRQIDEENARKAREAQEKRSVSTNFCFQLVLSLSVTCPPKAQHFLVPIIILILATRMHTESIYAVVTLYSHRVPVVNILPSRTHRSPSWNPTMYSAYEDFVAETNRIRKMNAIAKYRAKVSQEAHLASTNKSMARSVRAEQRQRKVQADALGELETKLLLRNMRLAEDTSVSGQSQLGVNRYRTDHFKGFSDEYRQTFYEVNARQMQENRDIKAAEAAREAGYAAHVANMNAIAREQAADRALRERQADMCLKGERKYHARVHKLREKQDQDRIMSQKVTDKFLGSFGHLQQ